MAVVKDRLVITGASGQLGRRVAEIALAAGEQDRLTLVTRSPGTLADLAARGAEIRYGDFTRPKSLRAAFAGGVRMLLISTTDLAHRSAQHGAAIDAAVAAGVEHVIYTSMLSPEPPNPALIAPSHLFTERTLAASALAWTVLRNSLYADFQVPEAVRGIAAHSFIHNRGSGQVAYVAREDCAAVAAAVLMATGHEAAIYEVTGSQAYGAAELAALYAELGGHGVEAVALDDEAFMAGLVGASAGDDHAKYGAQLVASFGQAIREGYMASCTDTVARLTGRPAQTLREVLAAKMKSAQS
jgi:NAD(P)H dehydrogenase (quinone)